MTRAEFWGKKILQKDPCSESEMRTLLDEARKEVKSKETTDDGVILWLFFDGSVMRTTPTNNGQGHIQWTK